MTGRTISGKYSLEREIGRGGMGAIWIAHDPQLKRRVALKLMRADQTTSPISRVRFEREAMAVAQIRNPHVVQVYDYGIDSGCPYIVMELLEGEDLDARLQRHTKLSIPAMLVILSQAAKALSTAHAAGIIHRDLKPGNIFLARSDADESVKLLDFGVAAIASSLAGEAGHATRVGTLLGTPHYMSPEQARGSKQLDHRSDIWSLGVVAYRALTGQHPFTSESLGDLIVRICTDTPMAATKVAPELPPEVDQFFDRALAKDPEHRFQSAREMAAAFAAVADAGRPDRPKKILVVDDEPDVALLIKQRFRQQIKKGIYDFVFAGDGEAALAELRRHGDIDVALTDINMPGMDGLTFLKHVGEASPLCKVIMVSAYGDMVNIRQAMNRGAFDFLVKPIDFKDLEVTIDKTLKHVSEIKRTIRSTEENSVLRMFVQSGIIERLLPALRDRDALMSEAVKATVAFINVHGFSETMRPMTAEAVIRTLNANFDVIVPEVTARSGVVDKFIGEAVMAVFRGKDHLDRAIDACIATRAQIGAMAEITKEPSPYAHGIAIGLDTGELIAGSIGSKMLSRLDYTVLGDAVSSAAHLRALASRDEILISEALYRAVGEAFICERISGRGPEAVYNILRRAEKAETVSDGPTVPMEATSEEPRDFSLHTAAQASRK